LVHIIEKSDSEKFLKANSATRSMNVSEAKLGSQRHEDEPSSEKTKKKTSLKSSEVRSILGKKKDYKLRASTATKNFMKSIPSFKVLKNDSILGKKKTINFVRVLRRNFF
jgi:hypothetical protein